LVPPPEPLLHAAKNNKAQLTIVDFGEKTSCRYVMASSEIWWRAPRPLALMTDKFRLQAEHVNHNLQ
jgi:hypothetical protein